MNASIRTVTASDVDALASMHAESWRSAYRGILSDAFLDAGLIENRKVLWNKRLSPQPSGHFGFVASVNGKNVGFAYAFGAYDEKWGTQLDNLHVMPEFKGQGIGSKLLTAVVKHLAAQDYPTGLFLWVYEQNLSARAFYESLGAVPIERIEIAAPDKSLVAEWRYAWDRSSLLLERLRAQQGAPEDALKQRDSER